MASLSGTWSLLPVELQAKIFRHVGAYPDLAKCRTVCEEFNLLIANKKYQCAQCHLVLFKRSSNPDQSFSRLEWEVETSRIILWYNSRPIDEIFLQPINAVRKMVRSIEIDESGTILDMSCSESVLSLVIQGKWPPHNDFKNAPAIVRKHCNPIDYPVESDLAFRDPNRLTEISGYPRKLPMFDDNDEKPQFWRSGVIIFPCFVNFDRPLLDRGFDVNEKGWLALLTNRNLRVMRPVNGHSFEDVATIDTSENGFDDGSDRGHRIRVRYRGDTVFVFAHFMITKFTVLSLDGREEERNGGYSLVEDESKFEDEYARQQQFVDVDVFKTYVVAVWRKWAGFYLKQDFEWFHAVSTSSVTIPPKSVALKNGYLHVSTGSCVLAFHPASRDPAVLWVNGNLPKDEDVPFCVSSTYGVFTAVHGDIVQSHYDAANAQAVFGNSATVGEGIPNPTPKPMLRDVGNHVVHERIGRKDPYETTQHIEYDESYGRYGRLLSFVAKSRTICMTVNRREFEPLLDVFVDAFQRTAPVEAMRNRNIERYWMNWVCIGDVLDVELADVGWQRCVVVKIYENVEVKLHIEEKNKVIRESLHSCRTCDLISTLSRCQQSEIHAVYSDYTRDYGEALVGFVLEQTLGLVPSRYNGDLVVRFRLQKF